MAWTKLAENLPEVDEPILIKNHGKTFFGIREQDEHGDFIYCQDDMKGNFVCLVSLDVPFTDPDIKWRYFDD